MIEQNINVIIELNERQCCDFTQIKYSPTQKITKNGRDQIFLPVLARTRYFVNKYLGELRFKGIVGIIPMHIDKIGDLIPVDPRWKYFVLIFLCKYWYRPTQNYIHEPR